MKKTAPIVVLAFIAALSMTSCKKKYTCECVSTTNGTVTATIAAENDKKTTKKDAEADCNQGDSEATVAGTTVKTDCNIK